MSKADRRVKQFDGAWKGGLVGIQPHFSGRYPQCYHLDSDGYHCYKGGLNVHHHFDYVPCGGCVRNLHDQDHPPI